MNTDQTAEAKPDRQDDGPLIQVRDLVVRFGDRTVLDGLTFDVMRGENFVILGGSGCGKSTLLRNLVGLMRPSEGTIIINGQDFTAMSDEERVELRKRMGMCFQASALFSSMSVGDNVALPLREHTKLEESTIDIMTQIKLELVGLGGFGDYMPSELSGGMKKRAGLARAMAMDPEIMFYDEPSAGLDPIVAAGLDELIRKLQSTFNLTSVIVTHELPSVRLVADRVCLLKEGKIVELGELNAVEGSQHPYARQFFERRPDDGDTDRPEYVREMTGVEQKEEGGANAGKEA
ncbi:MAG: ABC transporter ATP-binding protein [FCB group bacterium]|jgi:phospholipid/cholesterol/gamma-HCH transport system ATP-binding protein|nr:ABC transporter ATP-binding protein [FCB group bacterium]